FQGQEQKIVIISLVRSNEAVKICILKDYRRMNVAMTRAKEKLIIIGDSSTIGADPFYAELLSYSEEKNAYRSVWQIMY
ncbi:MAG: C-terminal helicase domain-containing protein, partial [Flavobacteriales bacterium]